MPSGILGQSTPSANTNTSVYTVPATKVATMNINIVNRGSTMSTVRLAIASTGTPANSEFIEFDAIIPANGVLERTGIVAQAAEQVVVFASTANTSVNVYGYEE